MRSAMCTFNQQLTRLKIFAFETALVSLPLWGFPRELQGGKKKEEKNCDTQTTV